jgi:hypothetical protein
MPHQDHSGEVEALGKILRGAANKGGVVSVVNKLGEVKPLPGRLSV